MSNREQAIKTLQEKGSVVIRCNGNSMRPIIAPGEAIHLIKVDPSLFRVGDAVFCKVKGSLTVHKIGGIDGDRVKGANIGDRVLIQNNHGFDNGFVNTNAIYGLCVQVEDRIVVSEEEMEKRKGE